MSLRVQHQPHASLEAAAPRGHVGMNCKYCQKGFSKGEHLRRHERSHTGSKPYMCRDCKRSFARQDSLARHERLHARHEGSSAYNSPPSDSIRSPATSTASHQSSVPSRSGLVFEHVPTPQHTPPIVDTQIPDVLQQITPGSGLDFELIWPDSEDLFQTISSFDALNHWPIPLGTLPFPTEQTPAPPASIGSPSSLSERVQSIEAIPDGRSHQAMHNVSKMISSLSSSMTAAIESTSITSVFLDECLHMFFVRFIPTFPVLHRPTFVFRDCTHPLLLNAMAIGSLYLGPSDAVTKGEILWRLAHTAVATSWQAMITHRGPYDTCEGVQLVITALLGQVYGMLSKNGSIRTASQAFHTMGFFWARHCGMFDVEKSTLNEVPLVNVPRAEKEQKWRLWVSKEIQHRAMLGHYMLDGLSLPMSGDPSAVRHASNQMHLPSSEAAFEADSADAWIFQMQSQPLETSTFRSIFRLLFAGTNDTCPLSVNFSAFSFKVVLEGFQSFISDCDEDNEGILGVPTKPETSRALARVYEAITQTASIPMADRLEILLRWHSVCLDSIMNLSFLCSYVCNRCDIEQKVWAKAKAANRNFDVNQWVNSTDGRRALLHSVAIQEIIEQLPRGRAHAIHMPSSLFAAAIIYSIFSLAGLVTVRLPATIEWNDVFISSDNLDRDFMGMPRMAATSETARYMWNANVSGHTSLVSRNLLYEFNSIQKLFGCLATQWGIAKEMGNVVNQWTALCR